MERLRKSGAKNHRNCLRFHQASFIQRILRAFVFALTLPALALASPLEEGNRAYAEGKYRDAGESYLSALESQPGQANVWYNLGNTHYRLGDKGQAALAYERALTLQPGHAEAAFNLNHIRQETGARLPEPTLLERATRAPESWLGKRAVPWIATGAFWAALFLLIPLYGKRSRSWISGVTLLLVAGWAGAAWVLDIVQGGDWLIIADKAQPRTAPVASAKGIGLPLPAASQVRLLQHGGEWVYVELPDRSRGWLLQDETAPVIPPADGDDSSS